MSIEVVNETDVEVDVDALGARRAFVLDRLRIHPQAELSVLLVDEAAMTDLHVQWMDEPGPTDVLSFPMDELRPTKDDEEPDGGAARRRRPLPAGRRSGRPTRPVTAARTSSRCC